MTRHEEDAWSSPLDDVDDTDPFGGLDDERQCFGCGDTICIDAEEHRVIKETGDYVCRGCFEDDPRDTVETPAPVCDLGTCDGSGYVRVSVGITNGVVEFESRPCGCKRES